MEIVIRNAAHQVSFKTIEDITNEEWELTFRVTSMPCSI